jgi:hypothetical protein
MSSVVRAPSQVGPFKRYVATAATALYDITGTAQAGVSIASGTVFADMGKTVYLTSGSPPAFTGNVLRKVQQLPTATSAARTGYIYIGDAVVPAAQKIAALN